MKVSIFYLVKSLMTEKSQNLVVFLWFITVSFKSGIEIEGSVELLEVTNSTKEDMLLDRETWCNCTLN